MSKRNQTQPESAVKTVDYDKAAAFVFSLPPNPVNLLSIDPTGATPTRPQTFKLKDKIAKWMAAQQAEGRNLYYQDCGASVINKRPKKNDVTTLYCAHVDAEVQPKNTPSGPEYDRKRAERLQQLLDYSPPPTVIVDSGNGYQAFWYLAEPIRATDDNIRCVEAINIFFRDKFGGDACQDIAHVMRVPSTKNFPNALKKKLGRVECVSAVIRDDHDVDFCLYDIDALPTAKVESNVIGLKAGAKGEYQAIGAPEIPGRVDLYKLPARLMTMIEKGTAGSRVIGDGSRSDLIYHIACEMRRREYSDAEILWTITNPNYEISSHYRDNPQRDEYDQASRVILRMNADGVVADADKRMAWDDECKIIKTPPSFVDLRKRELISYKTFDLTYGHLIKGTTPANRFGANSRHIERLDGICYRPNREGNTDPVERQGKLLFNIWRAHDIEPLDETPQVFLEHMTYLIPNESDREMLLDWLADLLQHPERKPMWAPLLLGPKRTGKSWIVELFKMILGAHNCGEPPKKRIVSEFNGWMAEKLFIAIHELKRKVNAHDSLAEALQEPITQSTVDLNRKGIEPVTIENTARFFTISNEDDAVDLDSTEGRYFVVQCALLPYGVESAPGNDPPYEWTDKATKYYERLWQGMSKPEIDANVPSAESRRVLSYLLKRKGGNVKLPVIAPPTQARSEMVDATRTEIERWLFERMQSKEWPFNGPVFNVKDVWERLPSTVPQKENTQRNVEKACKALGCRPLGGGQIDMGVLDGRKLGLKRLWVRDGSTADKLRRDWSNDKLAKAYRDGLAGVEEAQPGDFDEAPEREPWDTP